MTPIEACKQIIELSEKATKGPWDKFGMDAQGPFAISYPKEQGVAICVFDNAFVPAKGFHTPSSETPEPCEGAVNGTTYLPERVANVRFVAATRQFAPQAAKALMIAVEALEKIRTEGQFNAPFKAKTALAAISDAFKE